MLQGDTVKLGNSAKKCLIVITGPTGVGKTQLCTELAHAFDSPVLSADSRQMYREMKIGTAVPSPEQLEKVKHYFIGKLSVDDYYNASMFEMEAIELLDELFRGRNIVFMAGGSGLYVDAVCYGIDDLPASDPQIREFLTRKYKESGISWLRDELKNLDSDHFYTVDLKNPKRILKALEICYITGKPYSSFLTGKKKDRYFKIIKIGLNLDRKELYEIINRRVDDMMSQGLIEEVKHLCGFRHLNALNTVGYKELFEYLDGKISLDRAVELIKRNSRRYAKRQLTWLAKDKNINWFHPGEYGLIYDYIHLNLHNNQKT
jgi:tRNA dimethylallyltransferase